MLYICNTIRDSLLLLKLKKMKKFEFVKEIKIDGTNLWYTKCDGSYVNNSLSHNVDGAYEKFTLLSTGGSLENVQEILETKILD